MYLLFIFSEIFLFILIFFIIQSLSSFYLMSNNILPHTKHLLTYRPKLGTDNKQRIYCVCLCYCVIRQMLQWHNAMQQIIIPFFHIYQGERDCPFNSWVGGNKLMLTSQISYWLKKALSPLSKLSICEHNIHDQTWKIFKLKLYILQHPRVNIFHWWREKWLSINCRDMGRYSQLERFQQIEQLSWSTYNHHIIFFFVFLQLYCFITNKVT